MATGVYGLEDIIEYKKAGPTDLIELIPVPGGMNTFSTASSSGRTKPYRRGGIPLPPRRRAPPLETSISHRSCAPVLRAARVPSARP